VHESDRIHDRMVDRIGNCRVVGEIGSGGMAVVYKAVQEPLGRDVAIKALKPSVAIDTQFAQRFEREAHFMASLQHENILHVIDFLKDGRSMYIVMEYVQGIDLYDLLEHTPVLPPDVAAIIALQVARALDYAHFRGIVHRDIKPANVMISYRGEVKLMDFGIARDERLRDLTEAGTGLGTPSYMSPEQIVGDKVDFRSDLFSVGIVFYQMLTGRKPFVEDPQRSVMQAIRLDRYTPMRKINPSVPRGLERIVASCLEKVPSHRYASTQHLIDELMEYLVGRVGGSYAGRLVSYLLEIGLISESEAASVLEASSSEITRRNKLRDRRLVRHVGFAELALFASALVGGYVIQERNGGVSFESLLSAPVESTPLTMENSGKLKVVVDPWAHVYVDGEQVVTTPSAIPITLSSGKHYVKFENPYFEEELREIVVTAGETVDLSVTMTPREAQGDDE
jgi:eukaryotic-like serine/threonine-protein kinase